MTSQRADPPRADADTASRPSPVLVEVLICGSPDRGDDGAALVAASILALGLPADVRVRVIGRLDVDDLLDVPAGATVVIVDAATGIRPGQVLSVALDELAIDAAGLRPRSSHALAFPEVLGLATLLRGRPLEGRLVAIGGKDFTLGGPLSKRVKAAIPGFVSVVRWSIDQARIGRPIRVEG